MPFKPFTPEEFTKPVVWIQWRCDEGHSTRVIDRGDVVSPCTVCGDWNGDPDAPPEAYACRHCGYYFKDHAGTACLFAPNQFEPETKEQMQAESDKFWADQEPPAIR